MMHRKQHKCRVCNGKGRWIVKTIFGDILHSCLHCLGKGKWWEGKPKKAKGKS